MFSGLFGMPRTLLGGTIVLPEVRAEFKQGYIAGGRLHTLYLKTSVLYGVENWPIGDFGMFKVC